jgi:MFS family permease
MPTDARRWAMLCASLLSAMATTCVVSGVAFLIPELHRSEGMSLTEASTLAAAPTFGLLLSTYAWGIALDRFGERRILLLSLTSTVVAMTTACLANMWDAPKAVLGLTLLVAGITSAATNGAGGRIVVGWFSPEKRGTAMGVRQTAQPLGIGVCALTIPVLSEKFGVTTGLVVPLIVTVIATVVVWVVVADPHRPSSSATAAAPSPNPYRGSAFLPRIHAVSILLCVPQGMLWTFVPAWLIVAHDWSPMTAGILVTISQLLGAAGRIGAGRWSDVWGTRTKPIQQSRCRCHHGDRERDHGGRQRFGVHRDRRVLGAAMERPRPGGSEHRSIPLDGRVHTTVRHGHRGVRLSGRIPARGRSARRGDRIGSPR